MTCDFWEGYLSLLDDLSCRDVHVEADGVEMNNCAEAMSRLFLHHVSARALKKTQMSILAELMMEIGRKDDLLNSFLGRLLSALQEKRDSRAKSDVEYFVFLL